MILNNILHLLGRLFERLPKEERDHCGGVFADACTREVTMEGERHVCGVDGPCNGLPRAKGGEFFAAHTACRIPFGGMHHYQCKCHERMGNDFWFLPMDSCLYTGDKLSNIVTVDGVRRYHNGRMLLGRVDGCTEPGDPGYRSGGDKSAKAHDAIKAAGRRIAQQQGEHVGVDVTPRTIDTPDGPVFYIPPGTDAIDRSQRHMRELGRCDHCGNPEGVRSNLMFDLCPACEKLLREEHARYAARGLKPRTVMYTPRREGE